MRMLAKTIRKFARTEPINIGQGPNLVAIKEVIIKVYIKKFKKVISTLSPISEHVIKKKILQISINSSYIIYKFNFFKCYFIDKLQLINFVSFVRISLASPFFLFFLFSSSSLEYSY